MQDTVWIIIWAVIVGGTFAWLWRAGHLARFADYIKQTREELRKCTWPSWDELKGHDHSDQHLDHHPGRVHGRGGFRLLAAGPLDNEGLTTI